MKTDANGPSLSRFGDRHMVKLGGSRTNGWPWRATCDEPDARFDLRAALDYVCLDIRASCLRPRQSPVR